MGSFSGGNHATPPRRFVIGDIHGAFKALKQVLKRASFDPERDLLISLGDLCDRWPETDKVIDLLLTVSNRIVLLGNHDYWAREWFLTGKAQGIWIAQGGSDTMDAYPDGVPSTHVTLLQEALPFYEMDHRLFVHGGYPPGTDIRVHKPEVLLWDRSLIKAALEKERHGGGGKLTPYQEVYVGHTPTVNFGSATPIRACEVVMMDTGAGWPGGVLTMMDVDSGTVFQSEVVSDLYIIE